MLPPKKLKEPVNPFGGVPRSKQPPQISFDEAIRKVLPTEESIGRITKPISDFITEAQSTIKSIPDFISKASRETYRRKKEELGLRSFDTKPARAYDPRRSKKKERDPEGFIKKIDDTYGRFWGNRARELMIRAGEIEGTEEQREYIENIEPNWSGEKAERDEPDKEVSELEKQGARALALGEKLSRIHSEAVQAYKDFIETDPRAKANPEKYPIGPTVKKIKADIRRREAAEKKESLVNESFKNDLVNKMKFRLNR